MPVYGIFDESGRKTGETEDINNATSVNGKKIQTGEKVDKNHKISTFKFSNLFHGLGHVLDKGKSAKLPNTLDNSSRGASNKNSGNNVKNRPSKDNTHHD